MCDIMHEALLLFAQPNDSKSPAKPQILGRAMIWKRQKTVQVAQAIGNNIILCSARESPISTALARG